MKTKIGRKSCISGHPSNPTLLNTSDKFNGFALKWTTAAVVGNSEREEFVFIGGNIAPRGLETLTNEAGLRVWMAH
jgi:hypothetical protein